MNINYFISYLNEKINIYNNAIKQKEIYMNIEQRHCFNINVGSNISIRTKPSVILCVQSFISNDQRKPYFLDLRLSSYSVYNDQFELEEIMFNKNKLVEYIAKQKKKGHKFKVLRVFVSETVQSLRLIESYKDNNQIVKNIGVESSFIEPIFK